MNAMGVRVSSWLILLLLAMDSAPLWAAPSQHDAIPILLRRCTMCHGQTLKDGGVDLRTKASMLVGKAFVSGKPQESLLIKRIVSRACPPDQNISMAGIERMDKGELKTLRDSQRGSRNEAIKARYHGTKDDKLAQKYLEKAQNLAGLTPPEDEGICSLWVGGMPPVAGHGVQGVPGNVYTVTGVAKASGAN